MKLEEMESKTNPKSGKKYAPQYIESNLKAIISWAKWNRKIFDMKIKIADLSKRPTREFPLTMNCERCFMLLVPISELEPP